MTIPTPQQRKEIKEFFEVIERVTHRWPLASLRELYDMGLIILEPNASLQAKDIANLLPKGRTLFYTLKNSYEYEEFSKKLVTANREGQWFVVNCQADPAPTIITILNQISEENAFTLTHFEGKDLFQMELHPKTRIVFLINSQTLETEITYPYFLSLFGPVIRVK